MCDEPRPHQPSLSHLALHPLGLGRGPHSAHTPAFQGGDDVYSPTAAEIQALLQHGALNSSHHLQQQPQQQLPLQLLSQHSVTKGSVSFQFPASDQSGLAILNGGSDGMSSAAGSIFVNPLVSIGLEAGQDKGRNCADTSGMLGLIQKIQAVQVRCSGV